MDLESNLDIVDQSIGSMIGVLQDLQQEILDLRVDDLYNYIVEHRKAELYEHEIQAYKFYFNDSTYLTITDKINNKYGASYKIIDIQTQICKQFLEQYHQYEKQIIHQVKEMDNKQQLENLNDIEKKVIEWHSLITHKFNELTSKKYFLESDYQEYQYSDGIFTKLWNDQRFINFQNNTYLKSQQAVLFEIQNSEQSRKYQDNHEYDQILINLDEFNKYFQYQQYLNGLIDFLNAKLIYDISQIAKNSLMNIDKIMNYLHKQYLKYNHRLWREEFQNCESESIQQTCKQLVEKIRLLKYPTDAKTQLELYDQFKKIDQELSELINQDNRKNDYPIYIRKILRLIFDQFYKGQRKMVKLKNRYIEKAQLFEDTVDKQDLLNSLVQKEIQILHNKAKRLSNFSSYLFDLGMFNLSCYELNEKFNDILLKVDILISHYGLLMRLVGSKFLITDTAGRPAKKKIFEPYPTDDREMLTDKYYLNNSQQKL